MTYTLFQTNIQSAFGINHWIPFTEQEVNAQEKFASHFMTDFIKGKIKAEAAVEATNLFSSTAQNGHSGTSEGDSSFVGMTNVGMTNQDNQPLVFSEEATAVFDAGLSLWKYYHAQNDINVNASLYDIRAYFQGRNATGRMNTKSDDAQYMTLIGDLRKSLIVLADKIKPKVYEYGFLKE